MKKYLIFLFSFCLLSGSHGWAATWLDPALKWKTLETTHFSIYFHDGLEPIARKVAVYAEEAEDVLVPVMRHLPDIKTNVVLLDSVDYGNGFTTVVPDPRIVLYLTDWSSDLNPSKFDSWLRFVFLHEYAHVLHLDITSATFIPVRLLFGRIIFPNGVSPGFIIEGLATYMETKYAQGGRGDDPRWEMMMRQDVLENKVKSIDQAAVSTVQWPQGHLRYLYGVQFLEYLAEQYGEKKLAQFTYIYGDFLYTPIGVDGAFYLLYGKFLDQLWTEWLDNLQVKYTKLQNSLGKLTVPQLLTSSGYYNLKPKWSRDGKTIYFSQYNVDGYPSIRQIDAAGGREKKLTDSSSSSYHNALSLDPSGTQLLYSKTATYRNYYSYKDLYLQDLRNGRVKRLTEGARAAEGAISPDGRQIVYVKNSLGTNDLMTMNVNGRDPRLLSSTEGEVQYFSPSYSPDGKVIVVAKWTPGGQQKIYLVDPQTGGQKRLTATNDLTSEANPCFSPDGTYLYFDSDRTGIVNLYAFHLPTKRLFQLTNVIGGAMMPDASPDGKRLAYVSYSSAGYDIAALEIDPTSWREIRPTNNQLLASIPASTPKSQLPASIEVTLHDYNPLPTLAPKFWLPLEYNNENGSQMYLHTQGYDILEQHYYSATLGYDWQADRMQYSFAYANNQLRPQFYIQAAESAVPFSWYGTTLWMKERDELAAISLFQNALFQDWDSQSWTLGYEQLNLTNIGSLTAYSTVPSMGNIKGLFASWRYTNARSYAKSISFEDGLDLRAQVSRNTHDQGSDYQYTAYTASGAIYLPTLFDHHVLAPALYGFYSQGDQLAQSNFSWKNLPLRGYPSGVLSGNKGLSLSTEYRFPLLTLENGLMHGYTFFDRVWGKLFFDLGGATFSQVSNMSFKRSLGAELNLEAVLLWSYGLNLKVGYSKGLDAGGEEGIYFSLGL